MLNWPMKGDLRGVNEHDVKELMQSHGKSLTDDKF
jgi:hypothetical protein